MCIRYNPSLIIENIPLHDHAIYGFKMDRKNQNKQIYFKKISEEKRALEKHGIKGLTAPGHDKAVLDRPYLLMTMKSSAKVSAYFTLTCRKIQDFVSK